jgi:hypothetical protein
VTTKFALRSFTVLMVASLAITPRAFSQALESGSYTKTWDLFVGAACVSSSNPIEHESEWIASITQRPYTSHPSVGGTIEASGEVSSPSTTVSGVTTPGIGQLHTFMGGPSVIFQASRIQPFVRALLGTSVQKPQLVTSGTGVSVASTSTTGYFSFALGGGVDFPITPAAAVRGQVDWIRTYISATDMPSMMRASIGIVFRY